MRDLLISGILDTVPDCRLNGDPENRLSNNCSFTFAGINGEALLLRLDLAGIACSSGSACTTGSLEPSHVMRAMGVPYTAAHGAIRFSFSRYNTQEDVDTVVEVLPGIIEKIRAISPYWADFVAKR